MTEVLRLRSNAEVERAVPCALGSMPTECLRSIALPTATIVVVVAGFVCHVSREEWALLVVAIVLVWMAEALNTAIEFLADEVSAERRDRIGKAKDVGAFAVLVSALAAVMIGGLVFLPHLIPIK